MNRFNKYSEGEVSGAIIVHIKENSNVFLFYNVSESKEQA